MEQRPLPAAPEVLFAFHPIGMSALSRSMVSKSGAPEELGIDVVVEPTVDEVVVLCAAVVDVVEVEGAVVGAEAPFDACVPAVEQAANVIAIATTMATWMVSRSEGTDFKSTLLSSAKERIGRSPIRPE